MHSVIPLIHQVHPERNTKREMPTSVRSIDRTGVTRTCYALSASGGEEAQNIPLTKLSENFQNFPRNLNNWSMFI